jgi:hypothetical protein
MQRYECNKHNYLFINNSLKFYLLCENQGVTNLPPLKMNLAPEIQMEWKKKHGNSTFNSSSLSQVASSSVW